MKVQADYVGRVETRDPAGPLVDFPAVRIRLRFEGNALKVTTREWPGNEGSRYQLRLDGRDAGLFVPRAGVHEQFLLTGLAYGIHELEIFRRTEALYGQTQWLAFETPGGQGLAPPLRRSRRLMVLGDSMCTGYGIEGLLGLHRGCAANQNAALAFPEMLGVCFDAEVHNCSNSNTYLLAQHGTAEVANWQALLVRSCAWLNDSQWDVALYQPEVLLIMVGNDWTQTETTASPSFAAPPLPAYSQAYAQLLEQLRLDYPAAHLICSMSPAVHDNWPPSYPSYTEQSGVVTQVVARLQTDGDTRLHYFEFQRSTDDELSACEWHPGVPLHLSMARQLIGPIVRLTGWQPMQGWAERFLPA